MERAKKICLKLLRPHWLLILLLSAASAAGLAWVFLNGYDTSMVAIPVYVLSFYALTVLCIRLIPVMVRYARKKKLEADSIQPAQQTKQLKENLHRGVLVNLIYGVIRILRGYLLGSAWIGANGIYNVAFGFAYSILMGYERKLERVADRKQQRQLAWRCYRLCGFALFGLNLTMSGLMFQMIWLGRGESYSEIGIIALAAFTFYKLISAIVRVVRCRKSDSPVQGATRNMALTESLMSLFSLQVGLLSVFGQDFDQQFLMNTLTGIAVCLSTVLGGAGMVVHGKRKMKQITGEENDGKQRIL